VGIAGVALVHRPSRVARVAFQDLAVGEHEHVPERRPAKLAHDPDPDLDHDLDPDLDHDHDHDPDPDHDPDLDHDPDHDLDLDPDLDL
jgi:hypothetical protein